MREFAHEFGNFSLAEALTQIEALAGMKSHLIFAAALPG
jgi:hypothetical protein